MRYRAMGIEPVAVFSPSIFKRNWIRWLAGLGPLVVCLLMLYFGFERLLYVGVNAFPQAVAEECRAELVKRANHSDEALTLCLLIDAERPMGVDRKWGAWLESVCADQERTRRLCLIILRLCRENRLTPLATRNVIGAVINEVREQSIDSEILSKLYRRFSSAIIEDLPAYPKLSRFQKVMFRHNFLQSHYFYYRENVIITNSIDGKTGCEARVNRLVDADMTRDYQRFLREQVPYLLRLEKNSKNSVHGRILADSEMADQFTKLCSTDPKLLGVFCLNQIYFDSLPIWSRVKPRQKLESVFSASQIIAIVFHLEALVADFPRLKNMLARCKSVENALVEELFSELTVSSDDSNTVRYNCLLLARSTHGRELLFEWFSEQMLLNSADLAQVPQQNTERSRPGELTHLVARYTIYGEFERYGAASNDFERRQLDRMHKLLLRESDPEKLLETIKFFRALNNSSVEIRRGLWRGAVIGGFVNTLAPDKVRYFESMVKSFEKRRWKLLEDKSRNESR